MSEAIDTVFVGTRLDLYVSEAQQVTRSAAQNLIEGGAVRVNGQEKAKNYKFIHFFCIFIFAGKI